MLGDFNLPSVNWNLVAPWQPDIVSDFFCDSVINYFGLSQLVNKPTRGDALLDLILTNTPAHLAKVEIDCGLGNSDHNVVFFDFNVFISRPHQALKIVYDYENANWEGFRYMERIVPCCCEQKHRYTSFEKKKKGSLDNICNPSPFSQMETLIEKN